MAKSGEQISYRELDAEANQVAAMLRSAGLRPGDHAAFCLENHIRFFPLVWGLTYAGIIYTAMSSRLLTEEMAYIIENCGAKAFITSTYKSEQAKELLLTLDPSRSASSNGLDTWLMIDGVIDGYASFEESVASQPVEPLADRIAGSDMLYSSGTTGRPKGILNVSELLPLAEAVHPVAELEKLLFGVTSDTVYLSPAPLYHAAPLRFCIGVMVNGGTVVVMERFDPERFLEAIANHQVSFTQVVPTMFIRLLKLDEQTRLNYDVSSLEVCVHAAAPCPVGVKEEMIGWWGPIIHEYYAGTEGNGFVYCNSEMWLSHKGTVGQPLNCTVHIVDDDGVELTEAGSEGVVYLGGGRSFEYHQDEAKTADSRHPLGWSTLGDIGKVDSDGFLYLTDRQANMIITGGVNVYPQEAENILAVHPKVFDVAVIGVPNPDFGEEVRAVVQLAPSFEPSAELEQELLTYVRARLSDVKCPRAVDFRSELPRHPTGKLYKRLLRDQYWS